MPEKPYILGIDTSCDDTAFALLNRQTRQVMASVVSSQIKVHAPYGGVVPELASRAHLENMGPVFAEVLKLAGIGMDELGAVAVTHTPGLIGCLLVGASFARALAYQLNIPLYGINHLMGHLLSPFIEQKPVFPCLGLVVSGGHTAFYRMNDYSKVALLGSTVDDAAGEAFDKCAKMLSLGYPGGPVVDRLANQGNDAAFPFTMAKVKMGQQYLSFSGLKTGLYYHLQKCGEVTDQKKADLCASVRKAIVAALTNKMGYFFAEHPDLRSIAMSGGVALNSLLRKECLFVAERQGVVCHMALPKYCADNGAMIGFVALVTAQTDQRGQLAVQASQKIQARELARGDRV